MGLRPGNERKGRLFEDTGGHFVADNADDPLAR